MVVWELEVFFLGQQESWGMTRAEQGSYKNALKMGSLIHYHVTFRKQRLGLLTKTGCRDIQVT